MKNLNLLATFIFATLFMMPLKAQNTVVGNNSDNYIIYGKVVDAKNGKALHYASISFTDMSNVSNSEGYFSLKVPNVMMDDKQTITISFMGYRSVSRKLSDFSSSTLDNPLVIELSRVNYKIHAAIIRPDDAVSLFDSAFRRITDNYPVKDQGMTAFYREIIQKGSKYLTLNEAVIDINKAPYFGYQKDIAGIYKGRGSINYDSSDTLLIHYKGGLVSSLDIDMVKNPFGGVSLKDIHFYYKLSMAEDAIAEFDDKIFYVIDFNQHDQTEMLFRGKLYIDSKSLAIGRIEFNMNVEGRKDAINLFISKKPSDVSMSVDRASYVINYREINGLWYYDYSSIEVKFSARKRYSIFKSSYSLKSELAVTNILPDKISIDSKSRIKFRDILSDKVGNFTDATFWEDYNIIEPDRSIQDIISKIIKQLNKRQKEQEQSN